MKRALLSTLFVVTVAVWPALAQQPDLAPGQQRTAAQTDELVNKLLGEAQDLQARKRFLDALMKLDEAERMRPDNPSIYNMRGAIYLAGQVRDAEKAKQQFRQAMRLLPEEMPPHFNLAEVDFVMHQWQPALDGLTAVEQKFPKLPVAVRHLVSFKRLLCLTKLDRIPDAEAILKEHFTFMDDTPAYYFSLSVIEFAKKNEKQANDWLLKAQHIFKPADNSAYLDSLMESGYLHSLSVPKNVTDSPASLGPAKPE